MSTSQEKTSIRYKRNQFLKRFYEYKVQFAKETPNDRKKRMKRRLAKATGSKIEGNCCAPRARSLTDNHIFMKSLLRIMRLH